MRKRKGFLFIGNVIESLPTKSVKLADGYILKRANKNQINQIRRFIANKYDVQSLMWYEKKLVEADFGGEFEKLPEEGVRYWVVEYETNQASANISLALQLANIELVVVSEHLSSVVSVEGVVRNTDRAHNFFSEHIFGFRHKQVLKDDIDQIKSIIKQLDDFDKIKSQYPSIDKALTDYHKIMEISDRSPFKIVSQLSIFENLLVSSKEDNAKSITKQLGAKMNLLSNRFDVKYDHAKHFSCSNNVPISTIFSKIYTYRSEIAHGSESSFTKDLKLLNSKVCTMSYLNIMLKKVLLHAIKEPELVRDLKLC